MSDKNIITYIIILCLIIIFGYYYKKGKNKLIEQMGVSEYMNSSLHNIAIAPHASSLGLSLGNAETTLYSAASNYANFDGTSFMVGARKAKYGPIKYGAKEAIFGRDFFKPKPPGALSKFGDLLKPWIGGMMAKKKQAREVAKAGWDFEQCKQIYTDRCKGEVVIINKNTTVVVPTQGPFKGKRCVRNTKDKNTMSGCISPEQYCSRGYKTPFQKEGCQPAIKTLKLPDPTCAIRNCTIKEKKGGYLPSCTLNLNHSHPLPYQLRENDKENYDYLPEKLQTQYNNATNFTCQGSVKSCNLVNDRYHNLCVGVKMKEKIFMESMPKSIEKNKYKACQWISDFKGVSPNNWGWGVANDNDKCIWEFNKCKTKRLKNPSCQEISDIYLIGPDFDEKGQYKETPAGDHLGQIPKKIKDIWKDKKCKTYPPPVPPPDKLNFFPGCQWIADNRGPSEGIWDSSETLPLGVKVGDSKPPKNTYGLVREWWHQNCGKKHPEPKKENHSYVNSLSLDDSDTTKSIYKNEQKIESPWIMKQKKYSLLDTEISQLSTGKLDIGECQELSEKYGTYPGNWNLLYQPSDPNGELAKDMKKWLSMKCNTKPSQLAKENACQELSNKYGITPPYNWAKLGKWWTKRGSPEWSLAVSWWRGTGDLSRANSCKTRPGGKLKPNPQLIPKSLPLNQNTEKTISCQYISDSYNVFGNDWLKHNHFDKIPVSIKDYWEKNKCTTKPAKICQSLADNYGSKYQMFDENINDINDIKDPQKQCQWISNYKHTYPGNWGKLWSRPYGLLKPGTITPHKEPEHTMRYIWVRNNCKTSQTVDCQKNKNCAITHTDYGELKDIHKQKQWVSERCEDKKTEPIPLLKTDKTNMFNSLSEIEKYYGRDWTEIPLFRGVNDQNLRKFYKDNTIDVCKNLSNKYGIFTSNSPSPNNIKHHGTAPNNIKEKYKHLNCQTSPDDICQTLYDNYDMYYEKTGAGNYNEEINKLWVSNNCDNKKFIDTQTDICQKISNTYGVTVGDPTLGNLDYVDERIDLQRRISTKLSKQSPPPTTSEKNLEVSKFDNEAKNIQLMKQSIKQKWKNNKCQTKPWWKYSSQLDQNKYEKPHVDNECTYLRDHFGYGLQTTDIYCFGDKGGEQKWKQEPISDPLCSKYIKNGENNTYPYGLSPHGPWKWRKKHDPKASLQFKGNQECYNHISKWK